MLFMYIHTHSPDKCLVDKPQEVGKMVTRVRQESKKAGIKVLGSYVAAHEHKIFTVLEADDLSALEKALAPMTMWGDARLIPVTYAEALVSR
jgi:uncharacterized protein with GYD domain